MDAASGERVKHVYEWGLDPLHWAYAKLFIRDVLELQENTSFAGTYKLYNHVIMRVSIMGYVVSVAEKEKLFLFIDLKEGKLQDPANGEKSKAFHSLKALGINDYSRERVCGFGSEIWLR